MVNKNNSNIEEIKHDYKLITVAVVFIFIGIILIVLSYYSNRDNPGNIRAFLYLNLGSLSVIGAAYNLVNDLFLKRNFARQIRLSIDNKLARISLDETIQKFGLHAIQHVFSKEALINRITSSSRVLMMIMRNAEFFRYYCPEIRERIMRNDLRLTILMLSHSSQAISLLTRKFKDASKEALSASIKDVINIFIRGQIYDKLPEKCKNNLRLHLFDQFPVYSAYIFDDEEVWFVPYYFRSFKRPVPVFVLRGRSLVQENEIYRDIKEMQDHISTPHDLNDEV